MAGESETDSRETTELSDNPTAQEIVTEVKRLGTDKANLPKRYTVTLTSDLEAGDYYTLSRYYTVGSGELLVLWENQLLTPDVHYSEVGSTGATSSTIQFLDWDVPADSTLEFIFL